MRTHPLHFATLTLPVTFELCTFHRYVYEPLTNTGKVDRTCCTYRSSNRTVLETISLSHCSQVWLCVKLCLTWPPSTAMIEANRFLHDCLIYVKHYLPLFMRQPVSRTIEELFNSADDDCFHRVKTNTNHVLQPHLPDNTDLLYQLRTRSHNMTLINKTKFLTSDDFLIRMLYKYSY